jgi:hypothetical protein
MAFSVFSTPVEEMLAGRCVVGPASARIQIDGYEYINLCGSGYLALSRVVGIRDSVMRALQHATSFSQQLPPSMGAIDPVFESVEAGAAAACAMNVCTSWS